VRAKPRALGTHILPGTGFMPPRLHDASMVTLSTVIELFDEGFALGLGDDEKAGLVAFIEAAAEADEPCGTCEDRAWPSLLALDGRAPGASALAATIRRGRADGALLPIERLALGLADVPTMRCPDGEGGSCWRADARAESEEAFDGGARDEVEALWEKFRARLPS
jgi:hypothetical protein